MKNQFLFQISNRLRIGWIASVFFALGGLVQVAVAEVRLPAIFSDHMVLQAECPVTVWGWASPTEEVSVSIAGQTQTTIASAAGKWQVTLSPLAKTNAATTMIVKGHNALTVADVLVGEVWLGSGQSNMELQVKRSKDFAREKTQTGKPLI